MPQSLELVSHVSSANCKPPLQLEWSERPAESVIQPGSSQIHAVLPAADRTLSPNHPNHQLTSWWSALAAATGARLSRNTGVARYGSGSGPRPGRRPPAPACAGPGAIREFKILDSEAAGLRRHPLERVSFLRDDPNRDDPDQNIRTQPPTPTTRASSGTKPQYRVWLLRPATQLPPAPGPRHWPGAAQIAPETPRRDT